MTAVAGSAGYDPRRRIGVMIGVFALLIVALVVQLLRVQVLDRDRYVSWGEDQRLTTTELPGERGDILDRNGEELAISLNTPVIYTDPLLVSAPSEAAAALAPILGEDAADLEAILRSDGRFAYLERQSTEHIADQVRALDLDGVFIGEEPKRFHPNGDNLAGGVIGFVGYDDEAYSGLEAQYDEALSGIPGELISERGLNGRTIPEGERQRRPAVPGADLTLTLDRALQFEVEQVISESVRATGADGGIVIISEPATGHIVAMASVATDEYGLVAPTPDNRAVTWVYEPASVMKAVTFGAVMNEGLATPLTSRSVSDTYELYEETFTDDEIYGTRPMTATDILVASSNIGTILWAQALGDATFHNYLRDFGFGSPTGLDFPGESPGLLDDVGDWSGTSFATIAIGQGIAVTPLQMLMAYNVIANDGVYVAPRLVSSVEGPGGQTVPDAPAARRVIDSTAASDVTAMLSRVSQDGTARKARVPGYQIAAKTGTARKAQASGGYRDEDGNFHHVSTVAGFFPADAPKYSMIVILDEPKTEIYASRVTAPIFGELAAWTLRHYQVSPSADVVLEPQVAATPTPAIEPETIDEALSEPRGEVD